MPRIGLLQLVLYLFFISALAEAKSFVRVRVVAEQNYITISGFNLRFPEHQWRTSRLGMTKIKVRRTNRRGRMYWQVQNKGAVEHFRGGQLTLFGEIMRSPKKLLPGRLVFNARPKGIDLIAELRMDEYLKGVLVSEMPFWWPLEALKAQAVAARSYTLAKLERRKAFHYDLEDHVLDQVYRPWMGLKMNKNGMRNITRAVNETRDLYLSQREGKLMAYYHADCGGHTETSRAVWGKGTVNGATVDRYCPSSPRARWNLRVKRTELLSIAKKHRPQLAVNSVSSLLPFQISSSGRVQKLAMVFDKGPNLYLDGNEFRRLLGYKRLKSTMFKIQWQGDWFEFSGRGYGHGVGMCQWGARALAERGWDFRRILFHYYPQADLRTSPM